MCGCALRPLRPDIEHEPGSGRAADVMPERKKPPVSRTELNQCRRCPLWRNATQGVPGEGAAHARIMLVGEQPGAQEDLQGSPFVGPAGHLLDEALGKAGLDRDKLFMTNAVKCLRERGQGGPRRPARPTAQGHRRRVHRPDPRA
ncbi:hypothetical protein N234_03285 [Ralstonia pickettii DTP0602]|nr:hypothetical protein N234_03285 [Ralstonia pickettii DTP0602]